MERDGLRKFCIQDGGAIWAVTLSLNRRNAAPVTSKRVIVRFIMSTGETSFFRILKILSLDSDVTY